MSRWLLGHRLCTPGDFLCTSLVALISTPASTTAAGTIFKHEARAESTPFLELRPLAAENTLEAIFAAANTVESSICRTCTLVSSTSSATAATTTTTSFGSSPPASLVSALFEAKGFVSFVSWLELPR